MRLDMSMLRLTIFSFTLLVTGCQQPPDPIPDARNGRLIDADGIQAETYEGKTGNGALLLTGFHSFAELKSVVRIQFGEEIENASARNRALQVRLSHTCGTYEVTSILKSGISQDDFQAARNGTFWDRALLALKCPYAFFHKHQLRSVESLGRRRPWVYGKGDIAFYDLAETMVRNISPEDRATLPATDLSEKGYLNTFNHIASQAFMTSIFSERLADFVADVHELYNMPELITGFFTEKQVSDIENGPVDNYVDMINNEWGQELGKVLGQKYSIRPDTYWTPALLADYLNDIQLYHSWAFQIGFSPFRPTDEIVIRFAGKINDVVSQ